MAKVYNGTLLTFGADAFNKKWIRVESYKCTPNRLQDLDPFTAEDGTLHRNPVSNEPSTIEFETPPMMDDEEMGALMDFVRSHYVNAKNRDLRVTFFDQYTNSYRTETMYFNVNNEFEINYIDPRNNKIYYNPMTISLIGY
jgi:hypothetical protein